MKHFFSFMMVCIKEIFFLNVYMLALSVAVRAVVVK